MRKDMDYYTKRDDDSAIGDSANNSAEEESSNPGRKSIASDDLNDLSMEPHTQLHTKVGIKIPNCLLQDSEKPESSETREQKTRSFENRTKSGTKNPSNSSSTKRKGSNQMDLQMQLNYLVSEMRTLRELDRDILQKFVGLNSCIEEVRWTLAENEEKFRQNLEEDEEDFFSTLTDSRLDDLDLLEPSTPKEDSDFEKPRTFDTQSYYARSNRKPEISKVVNPEPENPKPSYLEPTVSQPKPISSSLYSSSKETTDAITMDSVPTISVDNPTYSNVDEQLIVDSPTKVKETSIKSVQREKTNENNHVRVQSSSTSPSDVWVTREKRKVTQQQQQPAPRRISRDAASSSKKDVQESATALARKYNDLILQKQQQQPQPKSRSAPRSASFRSSAEETPKVNHRTQWQKMEKQNEMKKVSDFQKNRDYQNLLGLSKVKGLGQVFQSIEKSSSKTSDSTGSLNSNSSDSISSLISPSRDLVGNSIKRNRYSGKSRSGSTYNRNNNNSNFSDLRTVTHLPPTKSVPTMHQRHRNMMTVPNKRASESSIYNWIRQQNDVSFF